MLQRLFILCLILVPLGVANASSQTPKGALCMIATDSQELVMIREILTGKLSLPGGTIEGGEAPQLAAQRETWEETGLVVTVGEEIFRNEKAIYYDCISDSEVIAYTTKTSQGHTLVPAWFAPHFGIEMNQVLIVEPLKVTDYRYNYHLKPIIEAVSKATPHSVKGVESAIQAAPAVYSSEFPFIHTLQNFVKQDSILFGLVVALDSIASPLLLMVILLFVYTQQPKVKATQISFAVVVSSLLTLAAQVGLAVAPPWAFMPQLQTEVVDVGFSSPSLATAVMVTLFGMLYRLQPTPRMVGPMIVVAALQALSSIALGNQYFTDVVLGAALGGLVVWHFVRSDRKMGDKFRTLFSSNLIWWVLVAVCVVLVTLWQRPEFTFWLALTIAIAAINGVLLQDNEQPLPFTKALIVVATGVGVVLVGYWGQTLVTSSSILSLIMLVSPFPAGLLASTILLRAFQR